MGNKFFYAKLAAVSIRKNARLYLPYLLTCVFTVAAYYILAALSLNPGLENMVVGSQSTPTILSMGVAVVTLFAYVFIFYTNSFLMKRRKKEFGLYNVLGMGKGHLSWVIFFETLYLAVISLAVGLGLGILLDKAAFLTLARLLGAEVPLGFYVSWTSILHALVIFGALFLLIFLNSLRQLHFANPIELIKGSQMGEKEPKARWLLAFLGAACLTAGYWIAVTITNPLQVLSLFFVAVILVILGTYCLFTAGSIALLKLLRKNRKFYYTPRHFISVSGMLYRMKQNAVGLANICILSTMVLVILSTTFSMYFGLDDMIQNNYPRDMEVRVGTPGQDLQESLEESVNAILSQKGSGPENSFCYSWLSMDVRVVDGTFAVDRETIDQNLTAPSYTLCVVTLQDYNRLMHTQKTLEDGEILLYTGSETYEGDHLRIGNTTYAIRERLEDFPPNGATAAAMNVRLCLVVKDWETLRAMNRMQNQGSGSLYGIACSYYFDLPETGEAQNQIVDALYTGLSRSYFDRVADQGNGDLQYLRISQQEEERGFYLGTVSGLLFIGVLLGGLFMMATILIIYYKQISEGYDDKERFAIMEKVGMDKGEVRQAVRSQVLTVFFLPLVVAGIHTAFAFPMISRLLKIMALQNTDFYIFCTVAVFLVFALCYGIIYALTARIYYRIVS